MLRYSAVEYFAQERAATPVLYKIMTMYTYDANI